MTSSSKSNIYFFYKKSFSLKHRKELKSFLRKIGKNESRKIEALNVIFCTDKELLTINKKYLNHDYYTDILTFELSDTCQPIHGEIYISIDRVAENAKRHQVSFTNELHRVIIHGVLHLCGYSDKSKKDQIIMREKENFYLSQYFS